MRRWIRLLGLISFPLLLARAEAQQPACPFSFGLVSKTGIDLNGNNLYTDSFDSTDPTKSTSGQYDFAKRQPNGNIAIGGSLTNSATNFPNANIFGVVYIGTSGSVTMGPNGSIGPTFTNPDTTVEQARADGWIGTNCTLYVPDVTLPPELSSAAFLGNINNITWVSSGDYQASGIFLSGNKTLNIVGTVRLYVNGDVNVTGNGMINISTNGCLQLYAAGNVLVAGNGVVNNTGLAIKSRFYGLPSSTFWVVVAANPWIGIVWAPEAALALGYGDMSGGFIASNIVLNGSVSIHYDEFLGIKVCSSASGNGGTDGTTGIRATGSDMSITFPAATLRLYTVEYSGDLTTNNWTGLASTNTLSCTGELMTVTDLGAGDLPQRFYRLRIHPDLLGQ